MKKRDVRVVVEERQREREKKGAGRGGSKMKYDLPPGRDVALLLSCSASTIRENVPWNKRASRDYNSVYRQNINYTIVFCFFFTKM
jgi:hypothetical protein